MILLKIKYQGISVGYLELQTYHPPDESLGLLWRYSKDMKEWTGFKNEWPHFDQALPYVTDDKNGEPVFEGDRVRHKKCDDSVSEGIISMEVSRGAVIDNWPLCFDLELIKEKL